MDTQLTCPTCGNPISASMKFCRSCGSPVEDAVKGAVEGPEAVSEASASKAPGSGTPAPTAAACPNCGSAINNPNQKFCAVCGSAVAASSGGPTAAPVGTAAAVPAGGPSAAPAGGVAPGPVPVAAGGAAATQGNAATGFNPASVTLGGADDAAFTAAFSYFGKAYLPGGQPSTVVDAKASERRAQEAAEEEEARAKEERDFSVHDGGTFCGAFATKLQAGAAPAAVMVKSSHDEAARRQAKNRLKRKVALGDMEQGAAVEAADKL